MTEPIGFGCTLRKEVCQTDGMEGERRQGGQNLLNGALAVETQMMTSEYRRKRRESPGNAESNGLGVGKRAAVKSDRERERQTGRESKRGTIRIPLSQQG